MSDIDLVRLNFNPQTLLALNVILGLVMFGVSLELKPADFKTALATPRALAIGRKHHVVPEQADRERARRRARASRSA